MSTGLFIFHRDLRIEDNRGLIECCKECKNVYTCFIFTPEQVSNKNEFRSKNSIQFMIESLQELEKSISSYGGKLHIYYGNHIQVLRKLLSDVSIDSVYFNTDYSPFAKDREDKTRKLCENKDIECNSIFDYYLYEPGTVKTSTGTYFKKYTPFYNNVVNNKVLPVTSYTFKNVFKKINSSFSFDFNLKDAYQQFASKNKDILVHGGRTNGLQKLTKAKKEQTNYQADRDFFVYKTTHLSAYLKYGCISVREMYYGLKGNTGVVRELIWREFFAHVLDGFPEVVGQSYQKKFRSIAWSKNQALLKKWKDGNTGYPIVDACMRELNNTGYMHNRGRMTVASVLIKVFLIDWREGEKYFAQQLTDYDIASNNGNWQGISGTGVDMKPYFRDMNPWIQSRKFDPNAEYIKKWVPELKNVAPSDIHKWDETYKKYKNISYPQPVNNYSSQKEKMITMYEKSFK